MRAMATVVAILTAYASADPAQDGPIIIENAYMLYSISSEGKNLGFVDRATGEDNLNHDTPSACAMVQCEGVEYPATSVVFAEGRLTFGFGKANAKAVIRVESRDLYIRLSVESVSGNHLESLTFLNVPLTLRGRPDESFGSCALSLNLATHVKKLPVLQSHLQASCYAKFGMEGAKVAIVAMPIGKMLPALKRVLTDADEMPRCTVAGPWAHDVPFNHGSYLFNFGSLTDANVDEWIAMAKKLGVTQIDHHGGSRFFRFGDFTLRSDK